MPVDPAAFYATPAPEPTPAAPTEPTEADVADMFFGSTPTLVSQYSGALADSAARLTDTHGWTAAERDAHVAAMAEVFADAHIAPTEAARLHTLIAHHARVPADAATAAEWTVAARQAVRERFPDDFTERLTRARDFVVHRPMLAQLLNATGVGSHPDLVVAFAEQATPTGLRVTPRVRGGGGR